jgi:mono/diheme cytochrome c family protein
MRNFFTGVFLTLLIMGIAIFLALKEGYVNFRADDEPSFLEKKFAMQAVDASTDRHAPDQKNPLTDNEENVVAGAKLYINHCAGCHGVPSNPSSQFAHSFYPPVPTFFTDAPDMPENQNFYIIQHGIRWSAMPAWDKTLSDAQTWQLVTFLSNIEKLPSAAKGEFDKMGLTEPATMPAATPSAPMRMKH